MLVEKTLYTLNDIVVVPERVSDITSRSECDPCVAKDPTMPPYGNGCKMLPLIVSPMNNVINDENYKCFLDEGIHVVIPRDNAKIDYATRVARWESLWTNVFVALSLSEFKQYFVNETHDISHGAYVCIDLANGHMKELLNSCLTAKRKYGSNLVIMTGNIANPKTYIDYARAGVDYVRCGIGCGSCCITASNTSIHYPMASLIDGCKYWKNEVESDRVSHVSVPKIIADGGFNNYDQIIKALALGADYCMCGKLFAQCIEACSNITSNEWLGGYSDPENKIKFEGSLIESPYKYTDYIKGLLKYDVHLYREYYGMSTKRAQTEFGGNGNKTSEGITTKIPVKYSIKGWVENFVSYLKSAMSYTSCKTLNEFIGGPICHLQSNSAYAAYFK